MEQAFVEACYLPVLRANPVPGFGALASLMSTTHPCCQMLDSIRSLPWVVVILACLTLGLAPFTPPHIVEKLQMLVQGRLRRPIDWFDLLLHAAPWALLVLKAALVVFRRS